MADVFDLELHENDRIVESDDDIIEVDDVSGIYYYKKKNRLENFKGHFRNKR